MVGGWGPLICAIIAYVSLYPKERGKLCVKLDPSPIQNWMDPYKGDSNPINIIKSPSHPPMKLFYIMCNIIVASSSIETVFFGFEYCFLKPKPSSSQ